MLLSRNELVCRRFATVIVLCFTLITTGCFEAKQSGEKRSTTSQAKSILLMPQHETMYCNLVVPSLERQVFALTIPEDIGCDEGLLLPHSERSRIQWDGMDKHGVAGKAKTSLSIPGKISYELELTSTHDTVDAAMTISNLSEVTWHNVWSFNCLSPARAPDFRDSELKRTFMSVKGEPTLLSSLPRKQEMGVYFHKQLSVEKQIPFISEIQGTHRDQTDRSWFITMSEDGKSYMAATSPDALFLFNNQALCCLHSAANFGNLAPGESKTVTCRFYFAKGSLDKFLKRWEKDQEGRP